MLELSLKRKNKLKNNILYMSVKFLYEKKLEVKSQDEQDPNLLIFFPNNFQTQFNCQSDEFVNIINLKQSSLKIATL